MNQKTTRCVVSIQPISKETMEGVKKKSGRSRNTTPAPDDALIKEIIHNTPTKNVDVKSDPTLSGDSPNKSTTNGKGKSKKEKNGSCSQSLSKNNGVSDVALNTNGSSHSDGSPLVIDETNGNHTEDEVLVPNAEQDNDELFPELIYDETSDNECNFDSSSPDFSPVGRSMTRRSQAKVIPTPETPQMLKNDVSISASPSLTIDLTGDSVDVPPSTDTPQPDQTMPISEKVMKMKDVYCLPASSVVDSTTEMVVNDPDAETDLKNETSEASHSKTETNFSKSRVKVSPYRRSTRISEHYSTIANYSGNNSTQDTDVPEDISSFSQDRSGLDETTLSCSQDSVQDENSTKSYTESLRSIKGRKSYRPLRELSLRNLTAIRHKAQKNDSTRNDEQISTTVDSANATVGSETRDTVLTDSSPKWTPVGHVIGRKRRQSPGAETPINAVESPALILSEGRTNTDSILEHPSKRQRLFGYVATPLRNLRDKVASSTPIIGRNYGKSQVTHNELLVPHDASIASAVEADEHMPMVADIVPGKTNGEHKWCSVM